MAEEWKPYCNVPVGAFLKFRSDGPIYKKIRNVGNQTLTFMRNGQEVQGIYYATRTTPVLVMDIERIQGITTAHKNLEAYHRIK